MSYEEAQAAAQIVTSPKPGGWSIENLIAWGEEPFGKWEFGETDRGVSVLIVH